MVRMVDLIRNGGDEDKPSSGRKSPQSRKGSGETGGGVSFTDAAATAGSPAQPASQPKGLGSPLQGPPGSGKSLSLPASLGQKEKYCPHLGGRKNQEKIIDYPAVSNVCYGAESREKKFLRTVVLPFSLVPAQRQREYCLATFRRCPIFQKIEKEKTEETG